MDENETGRSKGGRARANALSPEQRQEIAKKAAEARWDADLAQATHEGELRIGDLVLPVAVLGDGTRLLTNKAFLTALGRPWKGTYRRESAPTFLGAKNLEAFINMDLRSVLAAVEYRSIHGQRAVGYRAELLPMVCDVYLAARAKGDVLTDRQLPIAMQSEILVRSLSKVGIIALVDEATGYQHDRAKNALAKILEAFIVKELQPWVRTFPHEYYEQLFRLRGLDFSENSVKRPQYFGILTNDIVYKRLAPGVLEELKKVTPRGETGRFKHKMFQHLTGNVGYPKLREHLGSVVTIMKLSQNYKSFQETLNRLHPRYNETMPLQLDYHEEDDPGTGI